MFVGVDVPVVTDAPHHSVARTTVGFANRTEGTADRECARSIAFDRVAIDVGTLNQIRVSGVIRLSIFLKSPYLIVYVDVIKHVSTNTLSITY